MSHPATETVPVPCKCCGGLHPDCGCWNVDNLAALEGHLCYEPTERDAKGWSLGLAWHPKYPGQQRSAIAFHIDQFQTYIAEYLIAQAAVWSLPTDGHAFAVACKRASDSLALARQSLAYLDDNDPLGRVHPLNLSIGCNE